MMDGQRTTNLSAEGLQLLIARLKERGRGAPRLVPRPRGGPLPLSFAQERLWFLDRLLPGTAAYNMPAPLRLRGPLDAGALRRTLGEVVRRHEALRTRFAEQAGQPVQVIDPPERFPLPRVDLTALPEPSREAERERLLLADARRPFDLARGPLLRATLLRLAPEDHALALTMHHIVSDGWSLGVLTREMGALYPAFAGDQPSPLPALPIQYADYALWQREHLQGDTLAAHLDFWREQLAGMTPLELPTDRPRPAVQTFRGAHREVVVPGTLLAPLEALGRSERATAFMVLLTAFKALLARLTGQLDLAIGAPIANRNRSEVEGLIGYFANTVVLRTDLAGEPSFRELLRRVREATVAAYAHEDLPFERLVAELQPERDRSRSPLVQVLCGLQSWRALPMGRIGLEVLAAETATSRVDLALIWHQHPEEGRLRGILEYNTDLFHAATAERLLGQAATLLTAALEDPEGNLWELPLLDAAERAQLLGWSGAPARPRETTLPALVAEHARRTPAAPAVEFADGHLTYAELARRASRLAGHLRRLGVGPEARVGLLFAGIEPSAAMVVGMLGTLAAGAAYVPLDTASPEERLAAIAADAGLAALLVGAGERPAWAGALPTVGVGVATDRGTDGAGALERAAALPDSLAYLLYTSGSTGTPKAVGVTHRGIICRLCGTDYVELGPAERVAQIANPSFDLATFEVWGALLNGGCLVGIDRETVLAPERLAERLAAERISTILFTTSVFNQVARRVPGAFRGLRHVLFAGEAADAAAVRDALRQAPPERLINGYGPTECTVFAACHTVTAVPDDAITVPIGRAIANTDLYVVDPTLRLALRGVPGELLIGGDGVARGYWRQPQLTAERFVPHPWSDRPGERLYRTGDLVRWMSAGPRAKPETAGNMELEFLGRIDQQVKIRGFRIEPGEIEAALLASPAVAACAVIARRDGDLRDGDLRLVAYVAPTEPAAISTAGTLAAELRAFIASRVPSYMMPAAFVLLPQLPLNDRGKADRRALARLAPPGYVREAGEFVAPQTPYEQQIAASWEELLQVDRVGSRDDFFALGGHSLLANQALSRLRDLFGVEIQLGELFAEPTVAGLAARVETALATGGTAPAPPRLPRAAGRRDGPLPLSFAQERLWFLEQLEPGRAFYNIPLAARLTGPLSIAVLARCLREIVRRHEALRTTFHDDGGAPFQRVAPAATADDTALALVDLAALPAAGRENELRRRADAETRRPFDLARGPLFRAVLFRLGTGEADEHTITLTTHHIVSDGWSTTVLLRELGALYDAFAAGRPSPLAAPAVQYGEYAVWQRKRLQGAVLAEQLAWWRERLTGVPGLALPTDRPRPAVEAFHGRQRPVALSPALSEGLRELARSADVTLYMTLLAAFNTLLLRYTGQTDLVVGAPVANRNRSELEGTIGLFVNTVVLRTDLAGDPDFRTLLARQRAVTLDAYAHEEMPFEALVAELQPARDMSRNPLFQVMCTLQSQPWPVLRMGDLALGPYAVDSATAKFDLTVIWREAEGRLAGLVEHATDLFDDTTARRLYQHYEALLAAAAADPGRPLSELPLLCDAERHQLLLAWNDTPGERGARRVEEVLAERAARWPEAVAVAAGIAGLHGPRGLLSYAELGRRSDRLARYLRRLGVGAGARVAICAERSPDMVVGVLATLKAGAAYVPLDPSYPAERLAFMLADSRAAAVLTQESLLDRLPVDRPGAPAPRIIALDRDRDRIAREPAVPLTAAETGRRPEDPAYMIYTSGSTGRPKGVEVSHQTLANLLLWQEAGLGLAAPARTLQLSSLSFDASFHEIFSAWWGGGTLVLISEETRRDAAALLKVLERERIERLFLPFVALRQLAEAAAAWETAPALHLRDVITAGEQLQATPGVRRWFADLPGCRLHNHYGPSESHVVTALALPGDPAAWPALPPIGRPIANVRIHLVSPPLELAPAGAVGELSIGGLAFGAGYPGRPDATAEKFVPDPWSALPGARLYRTGDLARHRGDGEIEYLGRVDEQVKIRGFRVEPGEVETAVAGLPGVRAAVVLVHDGLAGGRGLVAHVVPAPGDDAADAAALRAALQRLLPDYMVPAHFVVRDTLPLTPSGKVDRRALAGAPLELAPRLRTAPRTASEELLAGLFAEVLGGAAVGADDDFFALGGHSLLGTRLMSRVRDLFGVELPLRELFAAPTVAGLATRIEAALLTAAGTDTLPPLVPVPRPSTGTALPLSFAQERLWFFDQLSPGAVTYNMPATLVLGGRLSLPPLAASLSAVAARHEALRTTFAKADGRPVQVIAPWREIPLPLIDLAALPAAAERGERERLAGEEARRPFDLARGPLLRAALVRLRATAAGADGARHLLLLTLHHIAADGWSIEILIREMTALYGAFAAGRAAALPSLPIQYADFAVWQRQALQGEVLARHLAFWRERLAGAPPLELPTDRPRPAVQTFRGAHRPIVLSAEVTARLTALGRDERATLFMVLSTLFRALLARTSGQLDLTIGAPIANRGRREIEGLIGLFVNTIALRVDLGGEPGLLAALHRERAAAIDAYAHQDLPFEKLVAELHLDRDPSRSPLVQALCGLQAQPELNLSGLTLSGLDAEPDTGTARVDLALNWQEAGGRLHGALEHNTDLFSAATAERLLRHFQALLAAALDDPDRPLWDLPLADAAERAQLLDEQSGAHAGEGREGQEEHERTLTALFAAQARRTPNAPAVEFADAAMTYAEVAARAACLAGRLRRLGVGADDRVGLAIAPSAAMVVGMLGILAAGGAYVPLDTAYPPERLAGLAEDAELAALVVAEGGAGAPDWAGGVPVVAVGMYTDGDTDGSTDGDAAPVAPESLAYILYTSGSTGTPKGVGVTHRGIVRLVCGTDCAQLGPFDRVAQIANPSFDAATWEVWGALLNGGCLVGIDRATVLSPERLAHALAAQRITALLLTTSLFNRVAREAPGAFRGLRHLLFGGEAADAAAVRDALRQDPPAELINAYGPTESTVIALCHRATAVADGAVTVPIGRAIARTEVYVADPTLRLAPRCTPGELLIGGEGLARGYWRRPQLTAERFVPHPWSDRPGERLYRTGDLVRWMMSEATGEMEFLGRIDQQVKIRGFRIEPGEVEAALLASPAVAACAVVPRRDGDLRDGDLRLVAYVVPAERAASAADIPGTLAAELRAFLASSLPSYMLPAAFVALPALPLNASGKADRRALARLAPPSYAGEAGEFVAPRTAVEQRIAASWAELLHVERVGARDDFFTLGGHSLLATQALSRLRDLFGVEIPLADLFAAPTVAGVAARVEAARAAAGGATASPLLPLPAEQRGGPLPLSFAQERLWFLEQLEPGLAFYNIPLAARLSGPLAVAVLARCLGELARRHESLRTTFTAVGGEPFQVVAPAAPEAILPLVDLAALPAGRREAELRDLAAAETRCSFDLGRGPLLRTVLFRCDEREHVVVMTTHHIVSDGWSMTVLLRELGVLYDAFAAGRPSPLPPPPIQYADYAVWQRGRLTGEVLAAQLAWWRERLTGVSGLALPTDRPRPAVETFRGRQRYVALSQALSERLRALAQSADVTLFMILLGGFHALLLRYTGQTDLAVGSPVANRNRSEVEGTIGFFANTLVMRTDLSGDPDFRTLLAREREVALGAYAHEEMPFEKLVAEIQPERDMSRNPLFQVMCVLQNQPWPVPRMGDLELGSFAVDNATAKFDLTMFWREAEGRLYGLVEHNTDLFDDSTARRFYRHYEALLAAAAADPGRRLAELPLLSAAERHQLLTEWNRPWTGAWQGRCVHRWVEAQTARTPREIAVVDGDRALTYAELNARANRLAHGLRRRGVGPEALAGICVERSLEMVVAALAVLKAGGALVALDPAYPRERLATIIDDAGLVVLLTERPLLAHFPQHAGIALLLARDGDPFPAESDENLDTPENAVDLDNPIYAIYTSGSTGQPKGILVTHRAFSNLLAWQLGEHQEGAGDGLGSGLTAGMRTVQYATFGFCVSFQEMFSSWCAGGTLVIADEATRRDVAGLAAFLDAQGIERLHLPFAALKHLADAAAGQDRLPRRLCEVITAGEQLQVTPAVRSLFSRLPGCTLANQYGASETHVVTALTLTGPPDGWPAIPPVGRPVANVRIHLLGSFAGGLEPVPAGVTGELYAGGACTPRCYLNDPVLTAQKLVPDPWSPEPGARLYRTGDGARYLADGRIEYHGRLDGQVKIRGFRVELGEVETVLARHPAVRDAAVVARPDAAGGKRLVAYVVPAGGVGVDIDPDTAFDELRAYLKRTLPDPMLPAAFVALPALPLNANGKLDQAALPEPAAFVGGTRAPYVAPRTPVEAEMAALYAELLQVAEVGAHDDFFALGGHSLLATRLMARVRDSFGLDLKVRTLFEAPTVEELAMAVTRELLGQADDEALAAALAELENEEALRHG